MVAAPVAEGSVPSTPVESGKGFGEGDRDGHGDEGSGRASLRSDSGSDRNRLEQERVR